jgi:hypothetical protein
MISHRSNVDTSYDDLAVVIHVDGFGSPGAKMNTWGFLHVNPPPNIWWGWKNFTPGNANPDLPMFTPKQTLAVKPTPVFISFQ